MSSKMEQIIEEIEEYIDGCKFQPLSSTKIIVNKEELEELIAELRAKTPEEVKRYQKIISNKEAILADAQAKADQIIAQAQVQTNELVSEHQIMQQAYAQANEVVMIATKQAQEILDNATNEANSLRVSAMGYADDQLHEIEEVLSNSIETSQARYDSLISSLQGFLDVVTKNRAQLFPQTEAAEEAAASAGQAARICPRSAARPTSSSSPPVRPVWSARRACAPVRSCWMSASTLARTATSAATPALPKLSRSSRLLPPCLAASAL